MDCLVVESFAWSPHLETAGEIALTEATEGARIGFAFLDVHNPDDSSAGPRHLNVGIWSRRHKVRRLERMLASFGVEIFAKPSLSISAGPNISQFVADAPTSLQGLRHYRYGYAALGIGVASSLVSRTGEPCPDLSHYRGLTKIYLKSAAVIFHLTQALLQRIQPRSLVTFNGRFACARAICEAARLLSVPVRFHERGTSVDRYELFTAAPQDLKSIRMEIRRCWQAGGADKREVAESVFYRRRRGDAIDWPSHTIRQQPGKLPKMSASKRQLVYFSSSDDELEFIQDVSQRRLFTNQREAILDLIRWVAARPDVELTIRTHPYLRDKNRKDREWWHSLAGPNVNVIAADSPVDTYALMDRADIVVTSGSTIGVEATFWGRPSVLLAESEYSDLGCAYEPDSMSELYAILSNPMLPPRPRDNCLPHGWYYATFGRRYQYYTPRTFFSGEFLGETLGYEADWIRAIKKLRVRR